MWASSGNGRSRLLEQQAGFCKRILQMCQQNAIKVGALDRIRRGMLVIANARARGSDENQLKLEMIQLSSVALKNEVERDGGHYRPVIQNITPKTVVLERRREWSEKYKENVVTEWKLEIAEKNTWKEFFKKAFWSLIEQASRGAELQDAVDILASRRVVFLKREEDIKTALEYSALGLKVKHTFTLLKVDESLDQATIQFLKEMTGEAGTGSVQPFGNLDSLSNAGPANPAKFFRGPPAAGPLVLS